jgi:hypothetical protein
VFVVPGAAVAFVIVELRAVEVEDSFRRTVITSAVADVTIATANGVAKAINI